jgi:hypothetical protein
MISKFLFYKFINKSIKFLNELLIKYENIPKTSLLFCLVAKKVTSYLEGLKLVALFCVLHALWPDNDEYTIKNIEYF